MSSIDSDEEWLRMAAALDGLDVEPTPSRLGDNPPQTLPEMIFRWRTSTAEYVDPAISSDRFTVTPQEFADERCCMPFASGQPRSDAALRKMIARQGYEPAGLAKLLAYGEHYPRAAAEFPLVALRDGIKGAGHYAGYVMYPAMCEDGGKRDLRLIWIRESESFPAGWRFLGIES